MVTKTARHMVCDWGMTELGPVALGENKDHVFLGQEIQRSQNYSESTAIEIDKKIHDIVSEQYLRATEILKDHREALEVCAQALLEYETIEGKHVYEILEHGEIRSPILGTVSTADTSEDADGLAEPVETTEHSEGDDEALSGDEPPIGAPA